MGILYTTTRIFLETKLKNTVIGKPGETDGTRNTEPHGNIFSTDSSISQKNPTWTNLCISLFVMLTNIWNVFMRKTATIR
jgi:hypothetical protein